MTWKLDELSLIDLASEMGNSTPGSVAHGTRAAEFVRRQTIAQINTAKYMLWSVIAIAITSGLNAMFAFLTWYVPHCIR